MDGALDEDFIYSNIKLKTNIHVEIMMVKNAINVYCNNIFC